MALLLRYKQINHCDKLIRLFGTKTSSNLQNATQKDLIGPPDPVSNLRPIIFAKSQNETHLEKRYREAREETQLWNQRFWTKHNTIFAEERKKFQECLTAQGKTSITADDMSIFYKEFLNKNWQSHVNYNVAWYKKNVKLLLLEIAVRLNKLRFK